MLRCRVHTLALPVVDSLAQVFRGVDLEAQLSLLAVNLAAKVDPFNAPTVHLTTCAFEEG